MKYLQFSYKVDLAFSEKIYEQRFQLRCLPQDDAYQKVLEIHYNVDPMDSFSVAPDGFSNTALIGNAMAPHDYFRFEVEGIVQTDRGRSEHENCHPVYHFQSDLTRYDPAMAELIPEEQDFNTRMEKLTSNIYYAIQYTPEATSVNTTAKEAFALKKGVCQDFSHIFLACARSLKIPARYVAGLMKGEGATHAWVEVYHDGCWRGYDPTNNRVIDDNYIVLSRGRDFRDCIIDKGIFQARHFSRQDMHVHVSVKEAEDR